MSGNVLITTEFVQSMTKYNDDGVTDDDLIMIMIV